MKVKEEKERGKASWVRREATLTATVSGGWQGSSERPSGVEEVGMGAKWCGGGEGFTGGVGEVNQWPLRLIDLGFKSPDFPPLTGCVISAGRRRPDRWVPPVSEIWRVTVR